MYKQFILSAFALAAISLPSALLASEETHNAAAQELLDVSSPKESFALIFKESFNPMLEGLARSGQNKQVIASIKELIAKTATDVVSDPELKKRMTQLYVNTFTEEELKEITAFYKTPTGQKSLQEMPILMQRGALIGQEIAQKYAADFQQELLKIMQGPDQSDTAEKTDKSQDSNESDE